MEYMFNENILSEENSEFLKEYFTYFISRETHSALMIDQNVDDPDDPKYGYMYTDNIKAFNSLFSLPMDKELDLTMIINTANQVNKSNEYISNGISTGGLDKMLDTDIPIPRTKDPTDDALGLLEVYQSALEEDNIFVAEALLHIGLIRYQLFEDGNHRTANLILDYNLMKRGIAPAVITEKIRKQYLDFINTTKVQELAELLKQQSIAECKTLNGLFETYKNQKRKTV